MIGTRTGREARGRAWASGFLLVALLAAMMLVAKPAPAATLIVNSTVEAGDNNPGDGTCATASVPVGTKPKCTLRAAIQEANVNGVSDTIVFDPALSGNINLSLGQLHIANDTPANDLIIRGPGANKIAVSGNDQSRIFYINDRSVVEIERLTIREGKHASIFNDGGTVRLTNSTVSDNSSGGIYNFGGTVRLTNSTVSDNSSDGSGGGIYNFGGTVRLTNSTVSGNSAAVAGGGIYSSGGTLDISGTLEMINSTVSDNTAAGTNGSGGGIVNNIGSTVKLSNTIIAGNSASTNPDAEGTFTSQGYNLIGDTTGATGFVASDLKNTNPLLGPLRNNGGPTSTHALLAGSPAIDAGTNASCPAADQRGVKRPQGLRCDIGAFERPNVRPIARNDSYRGVEDRILRVPARGVLKNDTDADGDALRASVVSKPKKGTLTLRPNGSFVYKPKKDFNGVVRFVYRTSDGRGGTDTATVTLRIKARPG